MHNKMEEVQQDGEGTTKSIMLYMCACTAALQNANVEVLICTSPVSACS